MASSPSRLGLALSPLDLIFMYDIDMDRDSDK